MRSIAVILSISFILNMGLTACTTSTNHRAPVVRISHQATPGYRSVKKKLVSPVVVVRNHSSVPVIVASQTPQVKETPIKPIQAKISNPPPLVLPKNTPSWQWPAEGALVRRYSEHAHAKGIDIGGVKGASVKAASGGLVVYSGQGLKGYGKLIIIKHNEQFLTAYAHNQELKVKEGERVKAGQEIALMGETEAERVKLHFEIRYQGKPVDPLRYLPSRN